MNTGDLPVEIGRAVMAAADEVVAGALQDHFVVDSFQAGAGVSQHMNMNEVLANRAEELLGGSRGTYDKVHPNDHVNRSQSTNDVFPTALRLASLVLLDELEASLCELAGAFELGAAEYSGVIKSARTHLQDAVPITLGQEFAGYAETIFRRTVKISECRGTLEQLNIGATAAGTRFNASDEYSTEVIAALRHASGRPGLRQANNLVGVTASIDSFVELSSALRNLAIELAKIAADLRLLSSGPRTGLAEIELPALQPGSSIMPGKVNPVIPEMLSMVCYQVIGNDTAIALAGQAGVLDLNVMTPLVAGNLLESLKMLTAASRVTTHLCVGGITADTVRCRRYAEDSLGLATALSSEIGYEAAAKVASEAMTEGKSIKEVAERNGFSPEQIERALRCSERPFPC